MSSGARVMIPNPYRTNGPISGRSRYHNQQMFDRQRSESPIKVGRILKDKTGDDLMVVDVLGTGGFATAFKVERIPAFGEHASARREFALKVVSSKKLNNPSQTDNMEREIAIHSEVSKDPESYAKIVRMYGSFKMSDSYILKLELCHSETLLDRINNSVNGLDERMCQRIIADIVEAIGYLLRRDILHRDIKPGNIFFDITGRTAKLGDFGLAKKKTQLTKSSGSGTPNYLAPEIVRQRGHSEKSEVWAIGCTLYCMLTKVPPFQMETLEETYRKIDSCEYNTRELVHTTYNCQDVIRRCLHGDPHSRINVAELASHQWLRGHVQVTPRSSRHVPEYSPSPYGNYDSGMAALSIRDRATWAPITSPAIDSSPQQNPTRTRNFNREDMRKPSLSSLPTQLQVDQQRELNANTYAGYTTSNQNLYYQQQQSQYQQQQQNAEPKRIHATKSANALVSACEHVYNYPPSTMNQAIHKPTVHSPSPIAQYQLAHQQQEYQQQQQQQQQYQNQYYQLANNNNDYESWVAASYDFHPHKLERQLSSGFGSLSHATTSGATSSSISPGIGCDYRLMNNNNYGEDECSSKGSSTFQLRGSQGALSVAPVETLDGEPYSSGKLRRRSSHDDQVTGMLRTRDSGFGGSDPDMALDEASLRNSLQAMVRDLEAACLHNHPNIVPYETSSLLVIRWVEGMEHKDICCELNDRTMCVTKIEEGTMISKKGRSLVYKTPRHQKKTVNLDTRNDLTAYHLEKLVEEKQNYMTKELNVNSQLYTTDNHHPLFLVRRYIPDDQKSVVLMFSNAVVQVNFGHKKRKVLLRRIPILPAEGEANESATWVYISPLQDKPAASFLIAPIHVDKSRMPQPRENMMIPDQDGPLLCRRMFMDLAEYLNRATPLAEHLNKATPQRQETQF